MFDHYFLIYLALMTLIALAVAHRLLHVLRDPGDRSSRALLFVMTGLLIALLLGNMTIYWAVYRFLGGIPALPQLIQHVAGMGVAYYAKAFIILVITPPHDSDAVQRRFRTHRLLLGAALALLLICYTLGPLRQGVALLSTSGSPDGGLTAYIVVWLSYLGWVLVDTLRLGRLHSWVEVGSLRIGLRMLMIGCVFGVVSVIHKIGYQLAVFMGLSLPWEESGPHGVQLLLLTPVIICLVSGILFPSWNSRVRRWWAWQRAYHQLTPLANALGEASPGPAQVGVRGIKAGLQRRIIGIRDALVGPLNGYLDAYVLELARERAGQAGLTDRETQVVAEAACIADAVERKSARMPAETSVAAALSAPPDWEREVTWLAQVSRAYTSSALVRDIIGQVRFRRRS